MANIMANSKGRYINHTTNQTAIHQLYQQRGPHQSTDMILQPKRQEGDNNFKVTRFRHSVAMFYFSWKDS